jgi:site-specific recombinase XerD
VKTTHIPLHALNGKRLRNFGEHDDADYCWLQWPCRAYFCSCLEHLTIGDLRLCGPQGKSQSFVQLRGKGNKIRFCPLWTSTTAVLKELIRGRTEQERVFLGRSRRAMTRFGVHDIVTRYARLARGNRAGLRHKRIGPHTIRHTTATHLLRAGVDINTIRAWLGHVSIDTTNIYAETDLEIKAKALWLLYLRSSVARLTHEEFC